MASGNLLRTDFGDPRPAVADVLQRVALAVNSSLDCHQVLEQLARLGMEATGAHRASVFVLDGSVLKPAVALAAQPDEDLWGSFRAMGPIELDPTRHEILRCGAAIAIEDARHGGLVPRQWVAAFSLRAIVLAPLLANAQPCGLLALDWPRPRTFATADLQLVEMIAAHAGLAVRNALVHDQTRRHADSTRPWREPRRPSPTRSTRPRSRLGWQPRAATCSAPRSAPSPSSIANAPGSPRSHATARRSSTCHWPTSRTTSCTGCGRNGPSISPSTSATTPGWRTFSTATGQAQPHTCWCRWSWRATPAASLFSGCRSG